MSTYHGVNVRLAYCLNSVLNVKALVGAFNQEKALVGAFSVIAKTDCETDGSFYSINRDPHNCYGSCSQPGPGCLACSNSSYLRCSRAGVPICLHPRLRCNHQASAV